MKKLISLLLAIAMIASFAACDTGDANNVQSSYPPDTEFEDYKIEFDSWQTFTVDISEFGENCTKFAFVIAAGNTIYIKDIVIE